jgi:hypothetical protein
VEIETEYKILVGIPEAINADVFLRTVCGNAVWVQLAQYEASIYKHVNKSLGSIKRRKFLD